VPFIALTLLVAQEEDLKPAAITPNGFHFTCLALPGEQVNGNCK